MCPQYRGVYISGGLIGDSTVLLPGLECTIPDQQVLFIFTEVTWNYTQVLSLIYTYIFLQVSLKMAETKKKVIFTTEREEQEHIKVLAPLLYHLRDDTVKNDTFLLFIWL